MNGKTVMSLTRALAELKRLDERIDRNTRESTFVAVLVGKNASQKVYDAQMTVDATKAKIQSGFDTITSLFTQREAIKAAVVKSNAVTLVKVGAREVTVAEAIEMKRSVINKKSLLNMLRTQQTRAQNTVSMLNAKLDEAIESNLKTIYGSEKGKADPAAYEAIAKPQREQKEASLLDPSNIVKVIETLTEEISVIETELDYTLSEVNAKTEISF